ncbi:MAG: hypothetical protein MZV63_02210 [Marinilabiliales bacterium]|nr:hypothetical protein [Marinilabiliales bacterium]
MTAVLHHAEGAHQARARTLPSDTTGTAVINISDTLDHNFGSSESRREGRLHLLLHQHRRC